MEFLNNLKTSWWKQLIFLMKKLWCQLYSYFASIFKLRDQKKHNKRNFEMRRVIYQIGRLDQQMKQLKFEYENKKYTKALSSLALKEHFGNDTKVVLIYPVSLPFNKNLISEKSSLEPEFKNEIKRILEGDSGRENYLKNPFEFFKKHTKESDDFILIHSIGEYEGVKFEGKYNDIVLEILFDLIRRHNQEKFVELYVDISTSLNIYILALLEAVRHFSVFNRLQNWGDERIVKIYSVFTDPIIGSSANLFKIYKEEMQYKTFFSSPVGKKDYKNYNLSKKIADDNRSLKQQIQSYLENFLVIFSSIKNSTPLALYTFERNEESEIEGLVKEIISLGDKKLKGDWQESPNLQNNDFLKCLLFLSFYLGILKVLNKRQILVGVNEGVDIEEIKDKFGSGENSTYKLFGLDLNIIFVGNEIWNLRREGIKKEKP